MPSGDNYRPEAAARVRVIGETPSSASIPFVTSIATPSSIVRILRDALHLVTTDPRYTAARAGLMISGVEDVPDDAYRGLLDYEKEAAELGYPQLL
jgi:ABC-type phosphate/phosphonate transport system substrate-binding protein